MRKELNDQARVLMTQIRGAERHGDEELALQADLLASLARANTRFGFAACAHHEMIATAHGLVADSVAMRGRMAAFHDRLSELAVGFGIDLKALGDSGKEADSIAVPRPTGVHLVAGDRQAA